MRLPQILIAAVLLVGCSVPYTMKTPPSFRRFEDPAVFKMITADGVKLAARQVDNYPEGDLDFWTDATSRHLAERGYLLKSESCFDGSGGNKACTLSFVLPYGTEDWTFSVTIFVEGDQLVLVEAAGPYERYARVEAELTEALKTFSANLQ